MNETTIFDKEIIVLEKRRNELEYERAQLLSGQLTVSGPDGNVIRLDLGSQAENGNGDAKQLEEQLHQTLVENPLVEELATSFKRKQELREELVLSGELPVSSRRSKFKAVLLANKKFNLKLKSKNKLAAKFASSNWLLALGLFALCVWGGLPFIYLLSGGALGGNQPGLRPATTSPRSTTAQPSLLPAILTPSSLISAAPRTSFTPDPTTRPNAAKDSNFGLINFSVSQVQTIQEETATATPQFSPTSQITVENGEMVGELPKAAGGLNGPHGAFFAPSRMTIAALELDTPVERAVSEEGPELASGQPKLLSVDWPRPGEVLHFGAYPGEIGNMVILGTQLNLNPLRHLEQNDEIKITDRKGNQFIYRVLPFSPAGQTERVIEPQNDGWVFAPTKEAILTIVVSMPRPSVLPSPDQLGGAHLGPDNFPPPSDDYASPKKLAYRAVLAVYIPKEVTPVGTPVEVSQEVWQPSPAPVPAPTPTPSPPPAAQVTTVTSTTSASPRQSPTPPEVVLPGLPHTGEGGGAGVLLTPLPTVRPAVSKHLKQGYLLCAN